MSAPVLRVAIVGCGVIGRQHASVVAANPDLELVVVIDPLPMVGTALADSVRADGHPRPEIYADLATALLHEAIDLVAICTPSGLHAALAVHALEAGAHVIIEKPIDVDLASARAVMSAADAARLRGQVTSVISQHRFDAGSVAVSRAIESGRFGRVTSAVASLAWWRAQDYYDSGDWRGTWELDGGGAVMNQGVHTIDLLLWFLGTPVEVHAHTALSAHERIEVEDTAVATVRFESGALAVIHCTTAAYPGLTARLQVHGDRGSAVLDNDRLSYFHAAGDDAESGSSYGLAGLGNQAAEEVGERESSENTSGADDLQSAHQRQYADVVTAIRSGVEPVVGVREAASALALVRAIYVSATVGRAVDFTDVLNGSYDEIVAVTGPTR
ncbi:Gfo/Idh/MocA family protein [Cryobacterium sp. Hz9]|uniref:Gfo/Idh/MocA family protein n=1 Tax=Cryobacterium sp. Hz9 TaxID=1259167 RepID=UPI00106AB420|nr:Gfo/Idh/MocA family oxidoreductase [Cryobacterium sp. Hz9]TFB67514.1 Gfo/Idh/MocA family oxidoreductase [Cryobacterium sp. Hz9]